jgi:hypothetical protein
MFSNKNVLFFNYLGAQGVQLLVKTNINLNTKNLEDKTAFDMAERDDIKKILKRAGAKPGSEVDLLPDYQLLADSLKSFITIIDKLLIYLSRFRSSLSDEERNTVMIIFTLVATAAYQAAMSPTGGVYQANANDNKAGKSVMSEDKFKGFSILNIVSFLTSMISILILTPRRGIHIFFPMYSLALSYLYSMAFISPTYTNLRDVMIIYFTICAAWTIIGIIVPMFSTRADLRKAMKLNGR